jgi:fumarylacetoacetase
VTVSDSGVVDPGLTSWVDVPDDGDFPIQNLPFGVFSTTGRPEPRVGVAIGEHILDLQAVQQAGLLDARFRFVESLHDVLGRPVDARAIRTRVAGLLTEGNGELSAVPDRGLVPQAAATMHLPFTIGDYVDFYSSKEHATNLGKLFRPGDPPLLPNWRHLPIGYHGRASTIVVSGTPIVRPHGQRKPAEGPPVFGPSIRLDIELEVGFFTGPGSRLGHSIPIDQAERHIAGIVLVNDWSARDIQAWEYRPLGPFLGKSFATSISPWVVTTDALAPYRVPAPPQAPEPLPHLRIEPNLGLDLHLEVELNGSVVIRTNFSGLYWTMAQQLAHVSSNGTAIRTGDLYASGTVSGPTRESAGSFLERTWNGEHPMRLYDGSTRTFLEDGDTVVLRGWCGGDGRPRVGFGECAGTVVTTPHERAGEPA